MVSSILRFFCLTLIVVALLSNFAVAGDESALFTGVSPDALIVLDLSGSMDYIPAGQDVYVHSGYSCGHSDVAHSAVKTAYYDKVCNDYGDVAIYSSALCGTSDVYYSNSNNSQGFTTDCRKVEIAKRALFDVLNADSSDNYIKSGITNSDDSAAGIRFGFMRFYNAGGDDTGGDYTSGSNKVPSGMDIGASFSKLYCNRTNGTCSQNDSNCSTGTSGNFICNSQANGGTPAASALVEAKLYLDANKASDPYKNCRDKVAILITDGQDTFACSGSGSDWQGDNYKRRRSIVAKAKVLKDAGYKVFVIGFGAGMPYYLANTLNWTAFYGGTTNVLTSQSGDTTAFVPPTSGHECDSAGTAGSANVPCYLYQCDSNNHGLTCPTPTSTACTPGSDNCYCYASSSDPGQTTLSGYAYIASNADEMRTSLAQTLAIIKAGTYSFSVAAISTTRVLSENNIYEASFSPIDDESFWKGFLRKYQIDSNGNVGSALWDAGDVLKNTLASSRNMYTYKSGAMITFNAGNLDPTDLGCTSGDTTCRDNIVKYFRGDPTYNEDNWKLGDIFHSNPFVISTPARGFIDWFDPGLNSKFESAYDSFRADNIRTSDNGRRVVVVGANDGQFHVFRTSDGSEVFSFIPPNLLTKLALVSHTHVEDQIGAGGKTHQYFVDGPVSAANIWLGSGTGPKSKSDWKTYVIFGLGRGADSDDNASTPNYLWSADSSCKGPFKDNYEAGYANYCGYYTFDITDTLNPIYKWRINPTAAQAPYFGEPWSKMTIGRIKYMGEERWVGFVGGGGFQYPAAPESCNDVAYTIPNPSTKGRGLFIIDLKTGNVLKSYTAGDTGLSTMRSIFAQPAIADMDGDGYIDTVYVGDLGGNMWRLTLCNANDAAAGCSSPTTQWSMSRLFDPSGGSQRPIYNSAVMTSDTSGATWVYWGTGDRQCPASTLNKHDHFFAIRDVKTASPQKYGYSDLVSMAWDSSTTFNAGSNLTKHGFYLTLDDANAEKVLGDPTVFSGIVLFTTYKPTPNPTEPCDRAGVTKLYGLDYTSGAGVFTSGAKSAQTSTGGMPSSLLVSVGPTGTPSLYLTVSGGYDTNASTFRFNNPDLEAKLKKGIVPAGTIYYWKDQRMN